MTKSFVDKLGLSVKRKLRKPINTSKTSIGNMIINDVARANKVADTYDFIGYTLGEYQKCLEDAVNDASTKMSGNYYIEITFAKDKLLKKVYRIVPIIRNSCPIPFYGKDVFYFNSREKKLEQLWAIPSKFVCNNKALIPLIMGGKSELLEAIENFNNGNYFRMYEKLINAGEIND